MKSVLPNLESPYPDPLIVQDTRDVFICDVDIEETIFIKERYDFSPHISWNALHIVQDLIELNKLKFVS